jgi:hypothetical protein
MPECVFHIVEAAMKAGPLDRAKKEQKNEMIPDTMRNRQPKR